MNGDGSCQTCGLLAGGVINKLGTCTLAMAAKALGVPFYVAAESYKVLVAAFSLLPAAQAMSQCLVPSLQLPGCLLLLSGCQV